MPQLHYWRYEELPGADSFSHIDPSDHEGREQAWAEVKQNLAEETAEWVQKGRELVALFEHARRSGDLTASWWFSRPHRPLKLEFDIVLLFAADKIRSGGQ